LALLLGFFSLSLSSFTAVVVVLVVVIVLLAVIDHPSELAVFFSISRLRKSGTLEKWEEIWFHKLNFFSPRGKNPSKQHYYLSLLGKCLTDLKKVECCASICLSLLGKCLAD
jgi:hypothetical protein